jgi:hypothetical protein
MPDVVVWEGDGHTFRIKSDDETVLETPFPTIADNPVVVLARDPATGLPMWAALTRIIPADTGTPLPEDTVVETTPVVPTTTVPDPVVDNCPQIRCGAAHQLAVKLAEQFELIRGLLQWMASAPFLLVVGPVIGGDAVTVSLLKLLVGWLIRTGADSVTTAVITFVLNKIASGAITAALTYESLGDAGVEQLALLAYVHLECTDNTFKLTPAMVGNWGAAILLDDVDFTEWQRHLLGFCIQFTPFQTYDQTAASGAQNPSDACSDWTGP